MDLPTQTGDGVETTYDVRVARAIDRVLEAERIAQVTVVECEKQGQESLERARQQRRTILERTQQRIVALHTRAARALERRVAQVREQHGQDATGGIADHQRLQAAIGILADRLIGLGDEES
jgi:hypothetical protein